jgi:sulfoxide reductase heme-binding subunit YedZ
MAGFAAATPSAYWYLTRGTGTVALILLTLSLALGVANARRLRTAGIPRFVFTAVHRNASLLAVVFLAVHIATVLLDGYVSVNLLNTIIPFSSSYRPFWLGLGAVAFDLLLAVTITSLLRHRFGYRAWRATHWAAYACWPIALVHAVGTGTDSGAGWMLVIVGACLSLTLAALLTRLGGAVSELPGGRAGLGARG